jgi:hypothetical protein
VRLKIVPCARFSVRAAKNRSVWALWRFVRAKFHSVRAKIDLCAKNSICAGKNPVFDRFWHLQVIKKRQFIPFDPHKAAP